MPIQFICPHCRRTTLVPEQYAGQSGPCAGCGQTVTVPLPPGMAGYAPPRRSTSTALIVCGVLMGAFALLLVGSVLYAVLTPGVQAAREAMRKSACDANIGQIGIALLLYESRHGSFPPAYVADKNGRPRHSWRVLILPELGERELYDQYRFDEPWDSEHNMALAARMPEVYRCPSDSAPNSLTTSYLRIVGPRTTTSGPAGRRLDEVHDHHATTILVIEAAQSEIVWTQPDDLDAATLSFEINDASPAPAIHSEHRNGVHAAMCDGSVRFLTDHLGAEAVQAMSTIAGGEWK